MKFSLTLLILLFGFHVYSQKTEFGLTLESGIALTGQDNSIEYFNKEQSYYYSAHLIRPHSIWNTKQVMFDVYPKWVDGLSLSVGLRMFTYGWEIDTISGSYYVGSTLSGYWQTVHARRESKFGYLTPTLGIGYQYKVGDAFSIKHSVSSGMLRILRKFKQHSYAYDPVGEGYFADQDGGKRDGFYPFSTKMDLVDFQLSTHFVYTIGGLSVYAGPAYFYQKSSYIMYSGLQLNGGISYRFHRKAD